MPLWLICDELKKAKPLLYLAGEELARDLAGELAHKGFDVVTQITYRMVPAKNLPSDVVDGIAAGRIDAVLHYSARSAAAFVRCAERAGLGDAVRTLAHYCLSEDVAAPLRKAGAGRVIVALRPDEASLLALIQE